MRPPPRSATRADTSSKLAFGETEAQPVAARAPQSHRALFTACLRRCWAASGGAGAVLQRRRRPRRPKALRIAAQEATRALRQPCRSLGRWLAAAAGEVRRKRARLSTRGGTGAGLASWDLPCRG